MAFDYDGQMALLDAQALEQVQAIGVQWLDPRMAQAYLARPPLPDARVDGAVLTCMYTAISALLGPELVFLQVFRAALERLSAERREWTWHVGHTLQGMLRRRDPHGWLGAPLDFQGELQGENCVIYFLDQELELSVPHPRELRPIIAELAHFLECHEQVVQEQSPRWTAATFADAERSDSDSASWISTEDSE
jgi:hypothetical protein